MESKKSKKSKKRLKCSFEGCNASYRKQCFLVVHMRKHSNERPFNCDVLGCEKSFTNVWHLKRHVGLVHDKVDEVICDIEGCGMVLSNRYSLKNHKNYVHSESSKLYSCAVCSEKFRQKRQLKRHIFTHSEAPVLRCTLCNLIFAQFHLYHKHKKSHKTYTCDCGKEFGKWTIFCEHRRNSCTIKNINHECIICKKVFTTKRNLTRHSLNVHVEESQNQVYRCTRKGCNRSYKYKKNLAFHIINNHEKVEETLPIKCTQAGCEAMLKTKINLKRHLARMHGETRELYIKLSRLPRKDIGIPRKCMASILSGVELPRKEHLDIINGHENSTSSSTHNLENIIEIDSDNTGDGEKGDKLPQAEAGGNLNSLLQLCDMMMNNIQDCLDLPPPEAITLESMACCEIKA